MKLIKFNELPKNVIDEIKNVYKHANIACGGLSVYGFLSPDSAKIFLCNVVKNTGYTFYKCSFIIYDTDPKVVKRITISELVKVGENFKIETATLGNIIFSRRIL